MPNNYHVILFYGLLQVLSADARDVRERFGEDNFVWRGLLTDRPDLSITAIHWHFSIILKHSYLCGIKTISYDRLEFCICVWTFPHCTAITIHRIRSQQFPHLHSLKVCKWLMHFWDHHEKLGSYTRIFRSLVIYNTCGLDLKLLTQMNLQ